MGVNKVKETVSRSRWTKRWGVALAIALTGSAMATTTTHAAKSKYGGEVTVAIGDTFPGFCVSNIPNHSALGGFRLIYEQLFERTPAGEYVGSLAESGTPNATLDQWTIKIRPNIKFTNGESFNADAAKLNIDLNATLYNAQNPTTAASEFATAGKGYASTGIGVNANIINVAKIDDLTIRIDLDHPQNDFLGVLYRAGRYVMRAPSQLWDPVTKKPNIAPYQTDATKTCGNYPIGTGPFKFVSFTTDTLVVEKNADYWRKNPINGDKLPYLDKITFVNVKEPSQRAAAVRKGTVDAGSFATSEATFVKGLRTSSTVTGYTAQTLWWGQWVPNVNKDGSPFKFENCRQAVAHAIDWKTYNKVRFKGLADVSGSIVSKGHPMYSLTGSPKYDVNVAKDYAAKCRVDLGGKDPSFVLYADTSTQSQNNVKMVQQYLNAANMAPGNTYIAEAAVLIGAVYGGPVTKMDITEGTPAEGGDSAYVSIFFTSSAFPTGAKSPVAATAIGKAYAKVIALSNNSDPEIDRLILAAQAAPTKAAAKTAWAAMTAYLQSKAYLIPSPHTTFYSFVNKKSKLMGIGKLPIGLTKKKFAATVTNKGLEWAGIYKG